MSHFTVLVISKTPDDVERLLAPYQENNMGDCPKEFLVFNDHEDEFLDDYNTKTTTRYRAPDGTLYRGSEDIFYRPATAEEREKYENDRFNFHSELGLRTKGRAAALEIRFIPEGFEEVEVPRKELYASFEEYVAVWEGFEKRDAETGRYGYWENPNAKWDWYAIGGRWSGMLRVKQGAEGARGDKGLMGSCYSEAGLDQVRRGDLDLDAMHAESRKQHVEAWDAAVAEYSKHPVDGLTFEQALARYEEVLAELKPKATREKSLYRLIDEHEEARSLRESVGMADFQFGIKPGAWSRETFVKSAVAFTTFAVVTADGKWYERGEMGWWGMVSDEKDGEQWASEFAKLVEAVPEDHYLTIVDCHI